MDSSIQDPEAPNTTSSTSAASPATGSARLTRIYATFMIILCVLANIPISKNFIRSTFALVPFATIGQSKVWNVITAGFVELHPLHCIINVLFFLTMGKWIETAWGPSQFLLYLLIVNLFAAACTSATMLSAFVVTKASDLIASPIGTTDGLCVALLIAVKQLIPEHQVGVGAIKLSANYLPLVYLTIVTILAMIQFSGPGELVFTYSAFQSAWIYLRFFQSRNGSRGDLSETFAYSTMFPPPFRAIVSIIANICFIIFKSILMAGQNSQQSQQTTESVSTKTANFDLERRRQLALKALDERLNENTKDDKSEENPV